MIYSYLRVSTIEQCLLNQRLKIKQFADGRGIEVEEEIAVEVSSRKNLEARRIDELMERLREGDLLICVSLSRLARNTVEIIQLIDNLLKQGVRLIVIDENLDLQKHDPMSKLLVTIFGAFAELERAIISERTKAGIERARAEGKQIGRKPYGSKFDNLASRIKQLYDSRVSIRRIALEHLPELELNNCTGLRKWMKQQSWFV